MTWEEFCKMAWDENNTPKYWKIKAMADGGATPEEKQTWGQKLKDFTDKHGEGKPPHPDTAPGTRRTTPPPRGNAGGTNSGGGDSWDDFFSRWQQDRSNRDWAGEYRRKAEGDHKAWQESHNKWRAENGFPPFDFERGTSAPPKNDPPKQEGFTPPRAEQPKDNPPPRADDDWKQRWDQNFGSGFQERMRQQRQNTQNAYERTQYKGKTFSEREADLGSAKAKFKGEFKAQPFRADKHFANAGRYVKAGWNTLDNINRANVKITGGAAGVAGGALLAGGLYERHVKSEIKKPSPKQPVGTRATNLSPVSRLLHREQLVNKNLSPFGVEHAISKADKAKPEYRASYLQRINPRSKTEVRRGTGIERAGRPMLGSIGGSVVGVIPGVVTHNPNLSRIGTAIGSSVGTSVGLTRNIKSGDTKSVNRRSGKKAHAKIALPGGYGTYNVY
jgi:hypothetical protein